MTTINESFGGDKKFTFGTIDKDPIQSIPDSAAADSINWLTLFGKIELMRGYAPLGTEINGIGRVTGLIVGEKANGDQVPFFSHGKKVKYFDTITNDVVEISLDILGTAADGEDVSFAKFEPRAGKQVWINSPHSGPKKIMVANPSSYSDMYDAAKNYKASLFINQNTAYNINMNATENNAVRSSFVEVRSLSDYTQITAEVLGAGDGVMTTFSGILSFKAGGSKRSALDVSLTDGTETFSDNLDGTLTGSLGGTGTINYTTGAVSVTFRNAPGFVNITSTYRWVDETEDGGIANFVVPPTRSPGDPNVFQQSTGGDAKAIFFLKEHRFVAHERSIYDITIALDDNDATNLLFREGQGIASLRGGIETAEGIYTIDTSEDNEPRFVIIGFAKASTEIQPFVISRNVNLSTYNFDNLVIFAWGDYILFSCQSSGGTANDTVFAYHRYFKSFDKLDYTVSCFGIYNGALIAGDSISNNVFTLFSGVDADGVNVYNYWKSGISKLKAQQLKKSKKIFLEGEVGPDQTIRMFVSLDRGAFVEVLDPDGNSFIQGNGDYVDRTQRVLVGAPTLGRTEVGGGSDGIEAYHYARQISFGQDKFSEIQIKFDAPGIGYASIIDCQFRDIRIKQNKVARKYRV